MGPCFTPWGVYEFHELRLEGNFERCTVRDTEGVPHAKYTSSSLLSRMTSSDMDGIATLRWQVLREGGVPLHLHGVVWGWRQRGEVRARDYFQVNNDIYTYLQYPNHE